MSSGSGARVAVLSDVHANPWALRAVLAEVQSAGVDLIVNCGDLVAGPLAGRGGRDPVRRRGAGGVGARKR